MVPKKAKSKPTIEQALMEWRVIYAGVIETLNDELEIDLEMGDRSDTAIETAARVAAEIWKGVDHGDNA